MTTDILQTLEFHEIQKKLAACAVSSLSKEMALSWEPSIREDVIARRLEETEEAMISMEREITTPLGETHDIRESLEKCGKDVILLPQEFMDLAASLETYKKMAQYFTGERSELYPALYEMTGNLIDEDRLIQRIRKVFGDHGEVSDNATPKLSRIRTEKTLVKSRIRREFQRLITDKEQAGYFQDAIITQRNGRYVVPVKAEYRYKFQGIVHDRSATGQTLFMEPMVSVQLNNDLAELTAAEKQEIHEILRMLSGEVKKEIRHIRENCAIATEVELIYARASLAISMKGVKAAADTRGRAKLIRARHPLIDPAKAVPIDICLGEDFQILIITGSNAGGKTIAMKTLGLLALMNQAGLFIPAAEGSRLPVYHHIYAVIGDDQSIQYNLSTFSSYITQMKDFLPSAGKDDLVLLDELGSGTDPIEGAALAQAVTEFLLRKGVPSIITSHFSEMKKLAYESEGIENAFVEFDEKTLTPTYRLIIGMAGNSNAFNICRRLGMDESILRRADELKCESPLNNMETVMANLNRELQQVEKEREELREKVGEAETLRNELASANDTIKEKKRAILDKAREQAEAMKRDLRIQSETIIKELKKQAAHLNKEGLAAGIDKARTAVNAIQIAKGGRDRAPVPPIDLKPGVYVFVDTLESVGVIEKVSGKKVTVRCGNLTVNVGAEHCFEAEKKEVPKKKQSRAVKVGGYSQVKSAQSVKTSINILGLTVDEAIPEVDRFLNDAVMAGISPVEIIHGKGTGALRKGIHDHLRTLNFVTEFHLADPRSGGAGVTEVYF